MADQKRKGGNDVNKLIEKFLSVKFLVASCKQTKCEPATARKRLKPVRFIYLVFFFLVRFLVGTKEEGDTIRRIIIPEVRKNSLSD